MDKKIFLFLLGTVLLAFVQLAEAQQGKVYRVGLLFIGGRPDTPALKGLRDGLKEAGYIEGKNLALDMPQNKTSDELPPIAKVYREKKVDVVVTIGSTATGIAKEANHEIPIVFLIPADPVRSGFVKSLPQPETNLTGLTAYPDSELQGKRLEVFKQVVPTLRRVIVIYNARAEAPHHAQGFGVVQKVAPSLGLKLGEKPIKSAAELEPAFSSVSKETTDGIFMIYSSLFRGSLKKIANIAGQKRLPLMACFAEGVAEQGSLVEYSTDLYRIGHRGAWYVDRILKGTKPQDLPVETPSKFELVINLKTAKQIGLSIPPEVLARADKVIK